MADYFTQFSCVLPTGDAPNLQTAINIYNLLAEEKSKADEVLGFTARGELDDVGQDTVWLYSDDGAGDPEDVIAYVFRCAEALNLTGIWGFRWSLSCSRPVLDGHGGGAHVLDFGTRQTIDWIDLDHWLSEQADAYHLRQKARGASI